MHIIKIDVKINFIHIHYLAIKYKYFYNKLRIISFTPISQYNFWHVQIVQTIVQIMANVLIIHAFVRMIGVDEIVLELFVQIIAVIVENVI